VVGPSATATIDAHRNLVMRIIRAGGPDMAPRPPALGRAPAKSWGASGSAS
jgi:hypothetical protein